MIFVSGLIIGQPALALSVETRPPRRGTNRSERPRRLIPTGRWKAGGG